MRHVPVWICVAAAAALLQAAPAGAAVVSFRGSLSVQIGDLPEVIVAGAGVATVNGSGSGPPVTALAIPGGVFATVATLPVDNFFPIVRVQVSLVNQPISVNFGGTCTAGATRLTCPGGGLAGFGGLSGMALVGLFFTHTAGSGTGSRPVANLSIPLSIAGLGGTAMATGLGVQVTASGAGWTTGGVMWKPYHEPNSVYLMCPKRVRRRFGRRTSATPCSAFGSRSTTSATFLGGNLQLVSPGHVSTNVTPPEGDGVVVAVRIHFVPEPATIVLLAAGVLLLLAGRRRLARPLPSSSRGAPGGGEGGLPAA